MDKVGQDSEYLGMVRVKHSGVGDLFKVGGPGSSSLWVEDVCDDPPHRTFHGVFHHRVNRRITGRKPQQLQDGIWEYPPLEEAMWGAGFDNMEAYVLINQNTVAQYIKTPPILELCEEAMWRLGMWLSKRW